MPPDSKLREFVGGPWECAMIARGIGLVIASAQLDLDLSEIDVLINLMQRFRMAAEA